MWCPKCTGEGLSQEGVAASAHALATAVIDQAGVTEDPSLMRAAAQMYAAAACIGTDAAAAQLMQAVCKDMAQTPLPARSVLPALLCMPLQADALSVVDCNACSRILCQKVSVVVLMLMLTHTHT